MLFAFLRTTVGQVSAAKPSSTDTQPKPVAHPLDRESPRGCVKGFLKAAEKDDYVTAAEYLNTQAPPARAQEVARQLKVVLDRGLSGNFDGLPRTTDGDLTGGLPANLQRVGYVKGRSNTFDVLLERVQRGTAPPIWLFSSLTVRETPSAFQEIDDFANHLPHALTRSGFFPFRCGAG